MALFNYECDEVKRKIDEVSPNYPQLTTFEKEWLFFHKYHYIPGIPVELEYETVSVNPTGMVSNAIPFGYQSAILKGQTLVNMFGNSRKTLTPTGLYWNVASSILNVKPNTKYYVKIKSNYSLDFKYRTPNQSIKEITDTNSQTFTFTSSSDTDIVLITRETNVEYVVDVIMLEYQDGIENWDISYFDGMQSVQMPVLKTVGKNLYEPTIKHYPNFTLSDGVVTSNNKRFLSDYIEVKPNTTYSISIDNADEFTGKNIFTFDANKNALTRVIDTSWFSCKFTTDSNAKYIRIPYALNPEIIVSEESIKGLKVQLEESLTNTSYEPYKSNILTVNEDATLRGIGDVKDTLDLTTGELTQRIGEIVLDGSEDWKVRQNKTNTISFHVDNLPINTFTDCANANKKMVCNKLIPFYGDNDDDREYIMGKVTGKGIIIGMFKTKVSGLSDFKEYLANNNIILQYQLAEPIVKTVDLTPLNKPYDGTNHYELTSNIPCEAILEVPVVSTGKQTLEEINN